MGNLTADSPKDPRFVAGIDLLRRAGAEEVQIRYHDDEEPMVWLCVAELRGGAYEAAGAISPLQAMMRLCETVIDGGNCAHCGKPCGVSDDWEHALPLDELVCWYVYDPETERFRRSCEGETTGRAFGVTKGGKVVGRNDPCPCGSGKKWKKCHGAG